MHHHSASSSLYSYSIVNPDFVLQINVTATASFFQLTTAVARWGHLLPFPHSTCNSTCNRTDTINLLGKDVAHDEHRLPLSRGAKDSLAVSIVTRGEAKCINLFSCIHTKLRVFVVQYKGSMAGKGGSEGREAYTPPLPLNPCHGCRRRVLFHLLGKHRPANGDGSCASWAGSQRIGVGLGACMTRERFTVCGFALLVAG
ncbi:hypothetical protein CI102_11441 [Trichoderma harzianum]|nr:hypothetical protein CI102_11441 [Trichoderma harzianum]